MLRRGSTSSGNHCSFSYQHYEPRALALALPSRAGPLGMPVGLPIPRRTLLPGPVLSQQRRKAVRAGVSEVKKNKKKNGGPGFLRGFAQSSSEDDTAVRGEEGSSANGGGPSSKDGGGAASNTSMGDALKARLSSGVADAASQQASAKLAVAARISAARALARKLAEEKQAAIAAARQVSQQMGDPEAAKQMKEAAEAEVAELAKAAARADSLARAATRAETGAAKLLEMQKLKAENDALSDLLLQLAGDRKAAEQRLAEIRQSLNPPKQVKEELEQTLEEMSSREEIEVPDEMAITQVLTDLQAARRALAKSATQDELQRMAKKASEQGQRVFTCPESPLAVGSLCKVYYERSRGPLPANNTKLTFKVGLNKWETLELIPMHRVGGLDSYGEWWEAEFPLPDDLFRADFVIMEDNSGAVDNNGRNDFQLQLSNAPTEAEVQMRRVAAFEAAEKQREKEIAAEEERIYAVAMEQAERQVQQAREQFRERKKMELLEDAQAAVSERRGKTVSSFSAVSSKPGVFSWIGNGPEAGSNSCLVYNKSYGPLRNAGALLVHVGYDGWWLQDKSVLRMEQLSADKVASYGLDKKGDWWAVTVPVWSTAAVLDFVFSDDRQAVWDNSGGFDFHSLVNNAPSGERLVELVYEALAESEAEEIERSEEAVAKKVLAKAHAKAMAARKRRERQTKFLYTKPLTPVAGRPVDIYYNPDHTVLNGRPEVYVRGSWNRWSHPVQFPPQHMKPTLKGGLGFLTATQEVPPDAHMMDVVFLDSKDSHGGFHDDNKGMGYHIPVIGGNGLMPNLKVVHIAVEMAPIAKAGGLGDVVTALSRAVQEEGHETEVIMPKYDCIDYSQVKGLGVAKDFYMKGTQVKVWKGVVEGLNTTFLEPCNGLFWMGRIYTDMNQDRNRFGFFCDVAMEYLRHHSERSADIVHCHDWQTAPIAWSDRGGAKCAFTIHNLNYGADLIGQAMRAADVCTTVSPTYAQEISGHPSIAPHLDKFRGITNGIDPDIWDPVEDRFLPRSYNSEDVVAGKAAAKRELRKRMNLSQADVPLVGCVTRLTHQKGIHLIKHAAWRTMERGGQFVLLGSAPDPKVQAEFNNLAQDLGRQYPDRARLCFAYDEPLSHLIYAGSDMFLVPSMFEPCGLTQMIAMRYGSIPVVRRTGGLNDTVFDVDHDAERAEAVGMEVNGFNFEGMDAPGMDYALNRALTRWFEDRQWWNGLASKVMQLDWSWSGPALDYIELYYKALTKSK